MRCWSLALGLWAGALLTAGLNSAAEPTTPRDVPAREARDPVPVAAAVDRALNKRLTEEEIPASPVASDAEFLRRVYLDITGRIPTTEQAAAFLDSTDPAKRRKLIDELLASPNYGQHFGIIWSDLIVKRDDANRILNTTGFKKWLADAFNEGRGWDRIVREMLTSTGTMEENAASMFFVANRDMNTLMPSKVIGATANLFMGTQLHCAECHNHPFIHDWKQTDFWGLAAFFNETRSAGGRVGAQNTPINITEGGAAPAGRRPGMGFARRSLKGAQIEIPDATDPRRSTGKIVKAKFFLDKEPALEETGPFRPVLADWLTTAENKFFAPAAVNRLWAHFFARGFTNPVDDMHDDNPPSHPDVLQLLADEFRVSGFDLKHVIRVICNSTAYQRTSKPLAANNEDAKFFSHQAVKIMNPEVLYDSLCAALGVTDLQTANAGPGRGFGAGGPRGGFGGPRAAFVNFFSVKEEGDDGTEMSFGIPQFLRLMNSRPFNEVGTVIDKVAAEDAEAAQVVEALFLRTLSRRPTEAEAKKMAAYVARKDDAKAGYSGVLWVLLNSAEFMCVR